MIHEDILIRYENMLKEFTPSCRENPGTGEGHLLWMLKQIRNHQTKHNVEKYHRWLGFIQGVLIMKGYTTVETERNFTRSYFKKEKE